MRNVWSFGKRGGGQKAAPLAWLCLAWLWLCLTWSLFSTCRVALESLRNLFETDAQLVRSLVIKKLEMFSAGFGAYVVFVLLKLGNNLEIIRNWLDPAWIESAQVWNWFDIRMDLVLEPVWSRPLSWLIWNCFGHKFGKNGTSLELVYTWFCNWLGVA